MYIDDTKLVEARLDDDAATVRDKIRANVRALYRATRREHPGISAAHVYQHARCDGYVATLWPLAEHWGLVRLRVEPDGIGWSIDDLAGDCFDPDVNDDIPPARLAREKAEFIDRVNRDGVTGIISEYRPVQAAVADDDDQWIEAYSCYGFVGEDWRGSGYDTDARASALSDLVDSVFGESGGVADMFALDEIDSVLIICRDVRRLATAA